MQDARTLGVRWMSACLVGGVLLSAYACGGGGGGGGSDEDDGSGGTGDSGGSGGDGAGGSSGATSSGGTSAGGTSAGGTSSGGTSSGGTSAGGTSSTDSGGSSSGGSAGEAGTGGVPEIDCTEDADCENADMVCDPLTENCVECLFDTDCGAGERCDAKTCVEAVDCTSSADCEGVSGAEACDTVGGHCVECVSLSDCSGTADCVDHQCRSYQACENSLDCPTPRVCDTSTGRCAQCVSSADCDDGLSCAAGTCRRSCSSDNDCTAQGLLCDFTWGACARCVTDSDCPDVYHCATGRCELDSCETGSGYCEGNLLYACNASGTGYTSTSCYSGQTCVEGEQAACQDWLCTPGATECNGAGTEVITCSADGLSIESSTDCTATDMLCYNASCQDLTCVPNHYYCEGNDRRYCNSDGMTSSFIETCGDGLFCDDSGTESVCADLLCEPDAPACNGRIATTCNAAGDGYVDDGAETDCADTDEYCVNGECRECNGSVLLLADSNTATAATLQTALEDAGLMVTVINSGTSSYAGTPAAADFGAVLNTVGDQYSTPMPLTGQEAIVAAHAAGTGYVTSEWASYQAVNIATAATLAPLVLMNYTSSYSSANSFTLTSSAHPIWDGLATTLSSTSYITGAIGTIVNSGVAIATYTTTGAATGPFVLVREGSGGRIVHHTHSGSQTTFISDANLVRVFVNSAQWAAGCK